MSEINRAKFISHVFVEIGYWCFRVARRPVATIVLDRPLHLAPGTYARDIAFKTSDRFTAGPEDSVIIVRAGDGDDPDLVVLGGSVNAAWRADAAFSWDGRGVLESSGCSIVNTRPRPTEGDDHVGE